MGFLMKTDISDDYISPSTGLDMFCGSSDVGLGPTLTYIRPTAFIDHKSFLYAPISLPVTILHMSIII
jgi:hypothetical protein